MVFGCLMLIFPSSFLILLENQWLLFQKFPCIRWLLCPVISLALPCPTILNLLSDAQNHVKYGYMFPKYFFPPSSLYHSSEVAQLCPTLCNPMDYSLPVPPSMGFSRQGYWSELPFPSPGDLPSPVIKPRSPALSFAWFQIWWFSTPFSVYVKPTYVFVHHEHLFN